MAPCFSKDTLTSVLSASDSNNARNAAARAAADARRAAEMAEYYARENEVKMDRKRGLGLVGAAMESVTGWFF